MTQEEHEAKEAQDRDVAAPDDLGFDLPKPVRLTKSRVLGGVAIGGAVVAVAFVVTYLPKVSARRALADSTEATDRQAPRVDVIAPKLLSSDRDVTLPGSVQPLEDTVLYPRANGYVKRFLVDIGDRVKEGQLLAEIETPELDQEIDQARAQLAQAQASLGLSRANRDFSKANLDRYKVLTPRGLTSQQDLDQRQAQSLVDEANVGAAQAGIAVQGANLKRFLQLKLFGRVVAPFAGTVTSRSIARGALVTEGNGTPLFRIAATDPVRVFVQVPQDIAPGVRIDTPAKVRLREYAGKTFDGKVARSAGALDAATRTMNTEIRVPNPKNELLTGMYAEVELTLPISHRVFELPATALISDAKGLHVAVVDGQNRIHFVPVTLERDAGATVQISSGLDGSERVVKISSAEFSDGATVEVRQ